MLCQWASQRPRAVGAIDYLNTTPVKLQQGQLQQCTCHIRYRCNESCWSCHPCRYHLVHFHSLAGDGWPIPNHETNRLGSIKTTSETETLRQLKYVHMYSSAPKSTISTTGNCFSQSKFRFTTTKHTFNIYIYTYTYIYIYIYIIIYISS